MADSTQGGVTPVGQQPGLQPPPGGFNTPALDELDEITYLAVRIEQAILDRAATWEVEFVEGPPGHAVGVCRCGADRSSGGARCLAR